MNIYRFQVRLSRVSRVLVSKETCDTVAYALNSLQERAELFLGPGISAYKGQIVGLNSREDDMIVNPAKSKVNEYESLWFGSKYIINTSYYFIIGRMLIVY